MAASDHRALHREAVAAAMSLVDRISASDLGRSTPCAAWDVQHLLDHMVGQHVGFTEAVRVGRASAGAYAPVSFTPQAWRTSGDALIEAFANADLDARVLQIELDPVRPLRISFLVLAQLLDTAVHTWDVAAALGELFTPPAEMTQTLLELAKGIPDDDRRDAPHAAFARALAADGTAWEQVLALLGRDPGWIRA